MAGSTLFTIGFAGKHAEEFFTILKDAGVRTVLDIRLNNVNQLAGFTKKDDLPFFLERLCGCGYQHRLEFAPTQEIIDGWRKKGLPWPEFERRYLALLESRPWSGLTASDLDRCCLLCSEATPEHCHRRLAAEWLAGKVGGVRIVHL